MLPANSLAQNKGILRTDGDDQGGTRDQGRCHAGTPGDGQRILAATRGPTGHAVRKRIVAEQQQHHAQRNVSEINPHVPFPPVENARYSAV
jgi:hypothetical protein